MVCQEKIADMVPWTCRTGRITLYMREEEADTEIINQHMH